eukprot:g8267.t1
MPRQRSNSKFLNSDAHTPPSVDNDKKTDVSFKGYSARHNATKATGGKPLNFLYSSTQNLIERAHRSRRYEQMVKLNHLSLSTWLKHSEYVGYQWNLLDYQHILISASWPKLIIIVTAFTFMFVLAFALFYFYVENNINSYWTAFNLSIQTFLTIGYGSIAPETDLGNMLVFLEVILSMAICAIFTGLVFLKFSKARAPILFANKAVVTNNNDGIPIVKIRCCLSRAGALLILPKFEVTLVMVEESYEGISMIRLRDLKLEASASVVLNANFNLVHDLTLDSPLRKHWISLYNAKKNNVEITPAKLSFALLVTVEGVEETFQTTVLHQHFIYPHDLAFDADYGDMMTMGTGSKRPTMEVLKLFDIVKGKYPLKANDIKAIPNIIRNSRQSLNSKQSFNSRQSLYFNSQGHSPKRLTTKELNQEIEVDENDATRLMGGLATTVDNNVNETRNSFMINNAAGHTAGKQRSRRLFCSCFRKHDVKSHVTHTVNIKSGSCTAIICHCSTYYWYSLNSSFSFVFCLMVFIYTLLTIFFALVLMLDPENSLLFDSFEHLDANNCTVTTSTRSTNALEFSTAFYFATQTLSSVGYGVLSPSTSYSDAIVTVVGFIGYLIISAISGIIWSRFAKAEIRLRFSDNVVVTNWNGEKILMIRIAGLFPSKPILKLNLTGSAVLKKPGVGYMKTYPLKFVRQTNPIFKLPGTWMHVIDTNSPLYHVRNRDLIKDKTVILFFAAEGYDTAFETSVYKTANYRKNNIKFDYHFKDIITFDHNKIH